MSKIIAIANQKGGVGKTTTTINLAACLAANQQRVLVIDIDPQGNTTSGFGIDKSNLNHSVYDVMINDIPISQVILPSKLENLHILPSDIALAGAEVELVQMMAREQILKNAVATVRDHYDYCIIDCPPSLGLLTLNAFAAADSIMVPIQCEYFALEGLSQLVNTIKLVQRHLNPYLDIEGVVLTMYDGRTNLSNQVAAEVQRFFTTKVYRTVIPRSIRLGEAPSYGVSIIEYAPQSSAAQAYLSLTNELLAANHSRKKG